MTTIKKRMIQGLAIGLTGYCLSLPTTLLAAPAQTVDQTLNPQHDPQENMVIALSSEKANVKQDKNGRQSITLHSYDQETPYFAIEPKRELITLSTRKMLNNWIRSAKETPNAPPVQAFLRLKQAGKPAMLKTVMLLPPTLDGNDVTFSLANNVLDKSELGQYQQAMLTFPADAHSDGGSLNYTLNRLKEKLSSEPVTLTANDKWHTLRQDFALMADDVE